QLDVDRPRVGESEGGGQGDRLGWRPSLACNFWGRCGFDGHRTVEPRPALTEGRGGQRGQEHRCGEHSVPTDPWHDSVPARFSLRTPTLSVVSALPAARLHHGARRTGGLPIWR